MFKISGKPVIYRYLLVFFKNDEIDLVAFKGKLRVGCSKLRPECHVNGDAPIFSRRTPKLALETSTARFLIQDERNRS